MSCLKLSQTHRALTLSLKSVNISTGAPQRQVRHKCCVAQTQQNLLWRIVSDPFFCDIYRLCGDLCLPIGPLDMLFKLFISSPKFQVTILPCTSSKILGFLENHPRDGLTLLGSHLSSGTRHITRTLTKTGSRKVTRLVPAVTNTPEPMPLASSPPHCPVEAYITPQIFSEQQA